MATNPRRIRTMRDVTAMVAPDTVNLLAERVQNLVAHGRRMSVTRRLTYRDSPPDVVAGLTLDGVPELRTNADGTAFHVTLQPGLTAGFGFAAYRSDDATEADAWQRYHAYKGSRMGLTDLTEVTIRGGLPKDGPARDDLIVVRRWNAAGVCIEQVVVFDYETGRHNDLTVVRDELRRHVGTLRDQQPWDNRVMFERLMAALDANAAVQGGDA